MKQKIKKLCEQIEKQNNIKILFAIENGSRAWRMESKDSDYDVRFVYVKPIEEYLQINAPKEVISMAFDKNLKECSVQGSLIDISGFDVFKYLELLSKSNPTTIEWITSDIVYYGKQNKTFKEFTTKNFDKVALFHFYKSMCKNNYLKYIKSGNLVTYKKYLYSYRGLINAKWVKHKKTIPPIIFKDTINKMKDIIPKEIADELNNIIKLKASKKEKDIIKNIKHMDSYLETFLKENSNFPKQKQIKNLSILNKELQKIILK